MKITTEDIQVGFHARQILKGISIESKDKELVGIIGPNGSGKSTLLKMHLPYPEARCRCRLSGRRRTPFHERKKLRQKKWQLWHSTITTTLILPYGKSC